MLAEQRFLALSREERAREREERAKEHAKARAKEAKERATDQACAAFCACVIITLGVDNKAVTRAGIEAQASEWRCAADICRAKLSKMLNSELVEHYTAVIMDLEDSAKFIEAAAPKNRSHYLERSSGAPGVDSRRAQAREIALGTQAIFGGFLYGTVATVMSSAMRRDDIDAKKVCDWCKGLPRDNCPGRPDQEPLKAPRPT
jgi:hypothetical protein